LPEIFGKFFGLNQQDDGEGKYPGGNIRNNSLAADRFLKQRM